jgi:hypothetical protein
MECKHRTFGFIGIVAAVLTSSACSATPQQIYHRSNLESGQAIVVIGVARGFSALRAI